MSLSLRREIIPEDILMEILVRLPGDSLMRFKRVSRLWSSLISSRYFTNLFFKFSSSRRWERRVFVYVNDRELFASSLCNLDATSSIPQLNPDLTLLGNRMQNGDDFGYSDLHFVNAMRGLMCFRDERGVRIINFITRQILILPPQVESNILMKSDDDGVVLGAYGSMIGRGPCMRNYLGYDLVNDEYKVLSTISTNDSNNEWRSETQVFVLGDGGSSWRNTKSLTSPPPHHRPYATGGISINGVLYYPALFHSLEFVLMSFDFSSEDYNLIKHSEDYNFSHILMDGDRNYYLLVNLMNYQDQVAVFDNHNPRLYTESILDLWVLEDAGQSIWSHKLFVLPNHQLRTILDTYYFDITGYGVCSVGEIAVSSEFGNGTEFKYIIYDLERNHITRVVAIKPPYIQARFFKMNVWEDVESIIYLQL